MRRTSASPRRLPEMRAEPHEQRVVVEHLLEVRHEPLRVHAVAREAAADLIVDAAARHPLKGVRHHREHVRVAGARPLPQREVERHRGRKLRRAIEAAESRLVSLLERRRGAREQILARACRSRACARCSSRTARASAPRCGRRSPVYSSTRRRTPSSTRRKLGMPCRSSGG